DGAEVPQVVQQGAAAGAVHELDLAEVDDDLGLGFDQPAQLTLEVLAIAGVEVFDLGRQHQDVVEVLARHVHAAVLLGAATGGGRRLAPLKLTCAAHAGNHPRGAGFQPAIGPGRLEAGPTAGQAEPCGPFQIFTSCTHCSPASVRE